MPVIRDEFPARRHRTRRLIGRLLSRERRELPPDPAPRGGDVRSALVDANTRTFWTRGDDAAATLIEANAAHSSPRSRRVAALVRAHESGASEHSRPRANPAFTEALFVELMRAHQFRRAFAMLSRECRDAWGSADRFASAQGGGPMGRLRGVRVLEVRHLSEWTDGSRGKSYRDVAELEVEYTVSSESGDARLRRVVHLVSERGRWWSLCYPS